MKRRTQMLAMVCMGCMAIISLGRCSGDSTTPDTGHANMPGKDAGKDTGSSCDCTDPTMPDCNGGVCQCNTGSCTNGATCQNGVCVPPGLDASTGCVPACTDPTLPVCSGGTKCVCSATSCAATKNCNADGTCHEKCEGVTCNTTGESCNTSDGQCECTTPGSQGACAANFVCSVNKKCVPVGPCATKVCDPTTPDCSVVGGVATCACNATSCTGGQVCTAGACVTPAGQDAGAADVGRADTGGTPPAETTIPVINNENDPNHAAFAKYPKNKVHFKGIVVSPLFRDDKYTGKTPKSWYCRMGLYLADPNATVPDYNGVLITSMGTVVQLPGDAGTPFPGACTQDSPLDKLFATNPPVIGDEVEVTGLYGLPDDGDWDVCYTGTTAGSRLCLQRDQNNAGINRAIVEVDPGSTITKTGNHYAVPASLPVTVAIDDISAGAISDDGKSDAGVALQTVQLGPKWWNYRQVLVKVANVKVTDNNGKSCNWTLQAQSGSTTGLIVQDDVMYAPPVGDCYPADGGVAPPPPACVMCPGRPDTVGTNFSAVVGFEAWYAYTGTTPAGSTAQTQLAPRGATDLVP